MNELTIEKNDLSVVSDFKPAGDQPNAIVELVEGLNNGEKNQVLLGATGTGKTCLLYTSPSPRDMRRSRMPSSA